MGVIPIIRTQLRGEGSDQKRTGAYMGKRVLSSAYVCIFAVYDSVV